MLHPLFKTFHILFFQFPHNSWSASFSRRFFSLSTATLIARRSCSATIRESYCAWAARSHNVVSNGTIFLVWRVPSFPPAMKALLFLFGSRFALSMLIKSRWIFACSSWKGLNCRWSTRPILIIVNKIKKCKRRALDWHWFWQKNRPAEWPRKRKIVGWSLEVIHLGKKGRGESERLMQTGKARPQNILHSSSKDAFHKREGTKRSSPFK